MPEPGDRSEPHPGSAVPADHPPGERRWHRSARQALLVLFAFAAALALTSNWLAYEILDDDRYVATMSDLAHDPTIQDAVAQAATDRLVSRFVTPDPAAESGSSRFLSTEGLTRAAAIALIDRAVRDVVQSDAFQALWASANRLAHPRLVALLRGDTVAGLNLENGQVVVDLTPLLAEVQARLRNIGFPSLLPDDPGSVTLVLFEAAGLTTAQRAVDLVVTLRWLLPVLAIAALAAFLWISPDRVRAIGAAGLALAVGMALALAILALLRNVSGGDPYGRLGVAASDAFVDIATQPLRSWLRGAALLGLVVAVGAWLLAPANAWRAAIDAFVTSHRNVLYGAIAALGALAVVLQDQPSIASLITIVLLAASAAALVWWLARPTGTAPVTS